MRIDFHNHLIPGVDDGAQTLDEALDALARMKGAGIHTVITTPHLRASLTERPAELEEALAGIDAGFDALRAAAAERVPGVRVERGVELALDTPTADISDPRLRLAGTSFVLVEFSHMSVPPNSSGALQRLVDNGWRPVIAHPERYQNLTQLDLVAEWRRIGCYLQVNAGSVLRRYGSEAAAMAEQLLRSGMVDYLASDYHSRGRLSVDECVAEMERRGDGIQAHMLTSSNPGRLLADLPPEPVAPTAQPRPAWRRFLPW